MKEDLNQNAGTILIVDDQPEIRQLLRILLKNKHYNVLEAINGKEAVEMAKQHSELDLILMDIMMPGLSGVDACRQIRESSRAPVLFLTARNTEEDKETAYENGGDDYLPKPFSQSELMMKVNSLIRRYRVYGGMQTSDNGWGSAADLLSVDSRSGRVRKNGQEIKLTDKEWELFQFLMNHRGEIMDVKTLYEAVWKSKYMPSSDNNVMVYIQRLRKKLEDDPANPVLIRTIYGRGYQID
ncbi:MAG: response regulator transcription factor [Oscillospiraceae bacterium]|nr:response regulator transcription factor [Oscillospiraceae bacterium]